MAERESGAKHPRREKMKNDPALVAKARELRDRWLEQVNGDPAMQGVLSHGKYDVSRKIQATPADAGQIALLQAA